MRTEEKGLRDPPPEGTQAHSPLLFPYRSALPRKERQGVEGWLPLSCVSLLTVVFLDLSQSSRSLLSAVNHQPLSFSLAYSLLDLHENYEKSKSFMCHIHSSQHILMITRCVWIFLNYSTSPFSPLPSLPLLLPPLCGQEKRILPFNCIQN